MKLYRLLFAPLLALGMFYVTAHAQYPYRASHERVEDLIDRIEMDADAFQDSVHKTFGNYEPGNIIVRREFSQSVDDLTWAARGLKDRFSENFTAVNAAKDVLNRGAKIDRYVDHLWLDPRANRNWTNLFWDLNELASVYHVGFNWSSSASQPYRNSHESMKGLMARIENRADRFRASLDRALDNSHFDGSRREDIINHFAKQFEEATDQLRDRFSDDDSATVVVNDVLRRGAEIDHFMRRHPLTFDAQRDWRAQLESLEELSRLYNVSMSWKDLDFL